MGIVIFGGGDMANKGIKPIVGGTIVEEPDCDVRKPEQIVKILEDYQPAVVINCAGVSHPSSIRDMSDLDLQDELDTNLLGSFYIAKYSALLGVKTMIFIASVAGMYGKPGHSGYSASKRGVISLVQSLGTEGYNAYSISPGRVDTAMREKDYPDDKPGTRLEPTEIGELVKDIIAGKYSPGDNLVIRRIGYATVPIKVDKGEPWCEELKVGQPKTL